MPGLDYINRSMVHSLWEKKTKNKSKPLCIALCISIVISLLSCVLLMSEKDIKRANKNRADIIISAVYEYEKVNKAFPHQLSDLVPEFLDTIPVTIGGDDFLYRMDSVNGFSIYFDVKPHLGCGYSDQSRQWECSYGD
jgi:hypothetical protein